MLVKDLRAKTPEELNKLVDDLKAELFMLRFKNSTGQLEQPHKINAVKKDIARVFTVLNEKDLVSTKKPVAKEAKVEEAK